MLDKLRLYAQSLRPRLSSFRHPSFPLRRLLPPASLSGLLPIPTDAGTPHPPSAVVVLSIIVGLPVALWTYKSLMMIIFQRKIIYMGYLPIGARKERLADMPPAYTAGMDCEEIHLPSADGAAQLSGLVVRPKGQTEPPKAVIVYFQGNAGGPLHRLPVFQTLLSSLYPSHAPSSSRIPCAIVAIAPRSYWTSTRRRPTQRGLLADYTSAVQYALSHFPDARIVLYGHSLGGAIAVCLLSELREGMTSPRDKRADATAPGPEGVDVDTKRIQGLILENPFASIPGMLAALYPQRWVPYRYLTAFVWDRWDALEALRSAVSVQSKEAEREKPALARLAHRMLVLISEHDEMVPPEMGRQIVRAALRGRREDPTAPDVPVPEAKVEGAAAGGGEAKEVARAGTKMVVIRGALHENAWDHRGWAEAMREYVREVVEHERW
ncbi:putative alpha beta superfamily protein [Lyophyllum shimeji]|uniref:Alpha beta superfamily protein n=1 Tax=Lyophyllum shimeji TaxID=47721 RepID=A0A9P3UQ24_LYOSH|nr:putative alpha beta superfamily protein [Lyophyllum shimeji]